ncbi:MAG: hypothetical protein Q4F21_12070 [Lachnospiraceae bacterium]|nr:hypothetical protein [Lachnospiraceae bacterium]
MNRKAKKLVVTCGLMMAFMFVGLPSVHEAGHMDNPFVIEAQAAETYSDNWKIDEAGTWWYYMNDGTLAKNCWIEDHGQWYLLDGSGAMRTGIVKSNGGKYYLLDTVRGTGYYGRMLQNGQVYNGVTIHADTASGSEGALSQDTLNALASVGVSHDNVVNVENTKHVSSGQVVYSGDTNTTGATQPAGNTQQPSTGDPILDKLRGEEIKSGGKGTTSDNVHSATDEQLEAIDKALRGA